MSRVLVLLLLALGLGASGCKSNCQQLSEELCNCAANAQLKAACLSRAATEAGNISATAQDNQLCGSLLNVCDCHTVNTYEGKVNCGLARARPYSPSR
jgi:hypothetical protein